MCDSVDSRSGLRRRRNLGKKAETFLPDDVFIEIISWLPPKDVLRTRCVCKSWRELTSTKDFIDLHIRRNFCMILKHPLDGVIRDRCWLPLRRARTHKTYERLNHGMYFYHNGLIAAYSCNLLRNGSDLQDEAFLIYNPIYSDVVRITVPLKPCKPCFYGVFFHPVMKEYCTLWRVTLSLKPLRIQYKILNLESDPEFRDIRNPSILNGRIPCMSSPLLFDKYLYWMVEPSGYYDDFDESTFICNIMEFDVGKEEFRVIPCPVPLIVNVKRCNYVVNVNVDLINNDGVLSLVQVFPCNESVKIDIWTLKDDGEQLWTRSNYVISPPVNLGYGVPKAYFLRNGEMVLQLRGRLYVCNLKLGTCRKFGQKHCYHVSVLSRVFGLVSLKNCKSNICMAEPG